MNKYKVEQIVEKYQKRYNVMADWADGVLPSITDEMIDLVHLEMSKEVNQLVAQEKFEIKSKSKMYKKLLRAKYKLVTIDKADAWFDKVFQKYFNKGILEHLIVYAVNFLHRNDLFVPQRLFTQINNDELLAKFTYSAIEYLGWTAQNEAAEPLTKDETEQIDEHKSTEEETTDSDEETEQEAKTTDVVAYEPTEQPVSKEITEDATDYNEEQDNSAQSTKKPLPSFYRAGGKSGGKKE